MPLRTIYRVVIWLLALVLLLALAGWLVLTRVPAFGAGSPPPRSERLLASPQFKDGSFHNTQAVASRSDGGFLGYVVEQSTGKQVRAPSAPIPVRPIPRETLTLGPGLRVYWLGHASVLLELDGTRLLVDPVFSQRASPFQWIGPEPDAADRRAGEDRGTVPVQPLVAWCPVAP